MRLFANSPYPLQAELVCTLVEVELEPMQAFNELSAMEKGSTITATQVQAALLDGPLFRFKSYKVQLAQP